MGVAKFIRHTILLVFFSITCATALPSIPARAANIRISAYGSLKFVVIEGPIEPGDSKKFLELVKRGQAQILGVSIFSPGGDFEEAMKIGRAMRALELGSSVPMRNVSGNPTCEKSASSVVPTPNDPKNCVCASACFFIHIGGTHRSGNFMAVHRPYFTKGKFGQLPEAEAKKKFDALQKTAKIYMNEMGVPEHIQAEVLGTSSDKALVLDEKTVKTYFWLEIPSQHEWLRNKCSELSSEEEGKLSQYRERLRVVGFDSDRAGFSKAEKDELKMFDRKEDSRTKCEIEAGQAIRVVAYKKYFGTQPTDLANHDFSIWTNSLKYLRKSFDDIKQEGETKEEPFVYGMTSLSFPETIDGFKLGFRDSEFEHRLVKTVDLFKRNTSKAFQEKVLKLLEKSWGKPKSMKVVDKTREYMWDKQKDGFWAELKQYPASGTPPFMTLEIGAFSRITK